MKSSGIIFPDRQDEKDIEKTFGQENLSTQNFQVNSSPASKDSPISGPAESEIENKQFKYDIPQKNRRNYISTTYRSANTSVSNRYKRDPIENLDQSNLSKSFKVDHERAMIRRKKYKDELKRIKGKNNKRTTKNKNNVVIKKSRKSLSNKKTSSIKTKDKKQELKTQIEKAKKNESEKGESILKDIFSLNIFKNVILRYVVAIISGVIIFGIIFSGLGLINR